MRFLEWTSLQLIAVTNVGVNSHTICPVLAPVILEHLFAKASHDEMLFLFWPKMLLNLWGKPKSKTVLVLNMTHSLLMARNFYSDISFCSLKVALLVTSYLGTLELKVTRAFSSKCTSADVPSSAFAYYALCSANTCANWPLIFLQSSSLI